MFVKFVSGYLDFFEVFVGNPSAGRGGGSCEDALAGSVTGLFKAGAIEQSGPWKTVQDAARETMHRGDWHDSGRLPGSVGDIPPAEAERRHLDRMQPMDKLA